MCWGRFRNAYLGLCRIRPSTNCQSRVYEAELVTAEYDLVSRLPSLKLNG